MKQLLEQAAADQASKEAKIAQLERRQKREADRIAKERDIAHAEAVRAKKEAEAAQHKLQGEIEEQVRIRDEELGHLREVEAKRREQGLADAARLREEEAKKWE